MGRIDIIKSPIASELNLFREMFGATLSSPVALLNDAIAHIRKRNGKMMRPALVLLFAKLYGKASDASLHGAVALELLHIASLIHDDVIDESDLRRGQASVNAAYDNKVAVIVGDFFLAACLGEAAKTHSKDIINTLAFFGKYLTEGELLQLSCTNGQEISEEIYFDIIRKKTAALFTACTLIGAYSVKATDEQCDFAASFGEKVGICFQIRDDLFDYYPDKGVGKPTGSDMMEGKFTLPAIHVLSHTTEEKPLRIARRIREQTASPEEITDLIEYIKQQGGIEYAERRMRDYHHEALSMLQTLPDSPVKTSLTAFTEHVVDREG